MVKNFDLRIRPLALMMGSACVMAALPLVPAQAQEQEPFDAEQVEQIQGVIKDYLMDNPDVIIDAVENYRVNQERNQQARAEEKIGEYQDFLTGALRQRWGEGFQALRRPRCRCRDHRIF